MARFFMALIAILIGSSWISQTALACRFTVYPPSEQDLLKPKSDEAAFQAIIKETIKHGPHKPPASVPHSGFSLRLEVTKVFKGEGLGQVVIVNYGPCHTVPGNTGAKINVLATKRGGQWHAPQRQFAGP